MLGPIGANLMSILKVLSPSEIDLYSEVNEEVIVQAMAVGAENLQYDEHTSSLAEDYKRRLAKKDEDDSEQESEDSEKAKIIPINKKVEQELSENGEFFAQKQKLEIPEEKKIIQSSDGNSLNAIGILSKNQQQEIDYKRKEAENSKKDSTSVFILDQREKLKQSRMKLVEQKAIMQYQKNSSAEMFSAKEVSEDELNEDQETWDSSSKGILINKRHY